MKRLLLAVLVSTLLSLSGHSGAQSLLDLRGDHAFAAEAVEASAERAYRARLRSLAADGRLDVNPQLLARLQILLEGLREAARFEMPDHAREITWEIHICRRCGENAAALAGGRLLVGEEFVTNAGLNDEELAYLLAHEMAHVLAEHTREFASIARYFVDNGRNRRFEDIQRELDESLPVGLRMADFYVRQEFEADYIGFILGARAGHEPGAMLRMLRKLRIDAPGLLSLHPDINARMQRAQSMLQTAYRLVEIGVPGQ